MLKKVVVQGVMNPNNVVLFGYWVPLDEGKPLTAIDDEVEVAFLDVTQELNPNSKWWPYEHVYDVKWWFDEFSEHKAAKVESKEGRHVTVELGYLRKALEYFHWVGGATSTWKTMLKSGVVDVYLATNEDAHELPLILVYDEYAAVIAPRLEGLEK